MQTHETLAYDIKGLVRATGRSRSAIQRAITAGALKARKTQVGGKIMVLRDDAEAWLRAMPVREPGEAI